MRHFPKIELAGVVLAMIGTNALLVGCAGTSVKTKGISTPQPSQTASSLPSSPVVARGSGACKYVTTAQASSLAGSAVKPGVVRSLSKGPVTFSFCTYTFDPGNSPGVNVAVADLAGQGPTYFAQFRTQQQSSSYYKVVDGVGDEAFFANGNLNVRKGNTGLILFVGRDSGYPRNVAGIPDEKALAALVLDQLP